MSVVEEDTARSAFARSVLDGLAQPQKRLEPRWFYDAVGAKLFEAITELDTYYPTRTEMALMRERASDIAAALGNGVSIVELGSGEALKVRPLLDALGRDAVRYVPIDIAGEQLRRIAMEFGGLYPHLEVIPIAADFFRPFSVPQSSDAVVYFAGSTIGNMAPDEAVAFLRTVMATANAERLLIGYDLEKDRAVLTAAYDDPAGVTAAFNKNVLQRINRELDGTFDLRAFTHRAVYNEAHSRVEMHLVSLAAQQVSVKGVSFAFDEGETIHTENSHKFSLARFAALAGRAGLTPRATWTDARDYFAVSLLERDG